MSIGVVELADGHVIGVNKAVIDKAKSWDSNNKENHFLRNQSGLSGTIGGVFYQPTGQGHMNLPVKKMVRH